MSIIKITQAAIRYGRSGWILTDVTLSIPPGECIAVTGANGSGKSTLLRLIAGVSRPARGTRTARPAVIGYVPDRFPAADAMSSIALLTHAGRIRGLRTTGATRRARHLLDRLDLVGGPRTPVRALSKGNAQKVALAQALMLPPDLLVLDEPWSGLDTTAHTVLAEILDEVVTAGGTAVFTDHREAVTHHHATTTYTVQSGRVTRTDRPTGAGGTARVVLIDRGGARPFDLTGIRTRGATAGSVELEVADDKCDGLLLTALRHGWSVAEVRRS